MKMTKQHFQLIAEALAEAREEVEHPENKPQRVKAVEKKGIDKVKQILKSKLERTNKHFDRTRFDKACFPEA